MKEAIADRISQRESREDRILDREFEVYTYTRYINRGFRIGSRTAAVWTQQISSRRVIGLLPPRLYCNTIVVTLLYRRAIVRARQNAR